jgi:CubicO group peptidase (beta-lactamase class C family)
MTSNRTLTALLDEYRHEHHVPGVAVATFDASGPTDTAASGLTSLDEPDRPLRPDTVFRIWSVTKTLTATLAAALAGDGVLDLDEPVTETLPEFRLRGRAGSAEVTLRHLLSHRAGFIPDAVSHERGSRDPSAIEATAAAEPPRTPLVGRPGQVYSYSNLGFIVAGHVIQVRAGRPFGQIWDERLGRPLGMERTTHDPAVAMTYPLLQHHVGDPAALRVGHLPWLAAKHAPSSQCWSTVTDMARLGALHLADGAGPAGPLAGELDIRQQRRPHADVRLDIDLRYGLGLYLGPWDGDQARFGHEGFYDGMWCKLLCVPAAGVGLVWADNRGEELREARYRVIDEILAGLGVAPGRWQRTDDSADPDGVEGAYERPASGAGLRLEYRAGRLLVQAADRHVALDPVAADVWATPADDRARPPWRAHAGSRRISVGAVRDEPGATACHVLLNGLPYRRV